MGGYIIDYNVVGTKFRSKNIIVTRIKFLQNQNNRFATSLEMTLLLTFFVSLFYAFNSDGKSSIKNKN